MNLLHLKIHQTSYYIHTDLIHPPIVMAVYLAECYFPQRIFIQNSTTAILNEWPGICRCHPLSHYILSLHCSKQKLTIVATSLVPRLPRSGTRISLVPRPLPRKAERGSGVLSDISCHMGRGRTA